MHIFILKKKSLLELTSHEKRFLIFQINSKIDRYFKKKIMNLNLTVKEKGLVRFVPLKKNHLFR